jgi:hypothetical protein
MAALPTARRVLRYAREKGEALFGMRPTAVGIVPGQGDDDFTLKVTLPSEPSADHLPLYLHGVPVRYAIGRSVLANSSPAWLLATRAAVAQSRGRKGGTKD